MSMSQSTFRFLHLDKFINLSSPTEMLFPHSILSGIIFIRNYREQRLISILAFCIVIHLTCSCIIVHPSFFAFLIIPCKAASYDFCHWSFNLHFRVYILYPISQNRETWTHASKSITNFIPTVA